MNAGRLCVVATPIGNLGDISARAIDTLRDADMIACEDTRHTQTLLTQHGITLPLISFHEHNEQRRTVELVGKLTAGSRVALVTDAGTPAVSDPGYRLIRGAIDAGVPVEWIPGASAVLGALVLSGLPVHRFTFEGFLPTKPGPRQKLLLQLHHEGRTVVAFESPHRLVKALGAIAEVYGDITMAVCRELTKIHEEVRRDTIAALQAHYATQPAKGEITLVFHP